MGWRLLRHNFGICYPLLPFRTLLKKIIRILLAGLPVFLLVFTCRYVYLSVPIITGFGAKYLCSSVFIQHRQAAEVIRDDLSKFPFSLVNYTITESDSSVSATVWGFAKQKAIYRKYAGATLVNDYNEADLRNQQFGLPNPSNLQADTLSWPDGDKLPDTIPVGIDTVLLRKVIGSQFSKDRQTRALLVIFNGQIVAEQYASGFNRYTPLPGWSIAKSITAALTGILIKQNKLNINANHLLPQWQHTEKENITLRELLQQTSGITYSENYLGPSEATTMLFKKGDMSGYIDGLPLENTPGTVFNYSSGNANLVSRIIRNKIDPKIYYGFPYTSLFYPIGMYHTILETDAGGTFTGSSYIYATARDYARFGLLYYENGKWDERQILSENWVHASVQPPAISILKNYGYFFWLNGFDKDHPERREFPDVPSDLYYASGFLGQGIYIIPSKKLVVVRLGQHETDVNELLKNIIIATQSAVK